MKNLSTREKMRISLRWAEDDHFLREENFIQFENDHHSTDLNVDYQLDPFPDLPREDKETDEAGIVETDSTSLSAELQHSSLPLFPNTPRQVRKSDMHKKPFGRWNTEAGFVPHPPRSTKKKIPEDMREGIPNHLIFLILFFFLVRRSIIQL